MTQATSRYAGFCRRFLAYSIDSIILVLIGIAFGITMHQVGRVNLQIYLPSFLISIAYFAYFWIKHEGQTPGNKLLAIKVMREDKKPLDITTALIRYFGYIISSFIFYLGFLWALWDTKKQGWHDKIAKTIVVETDEKPKTTLALIIVAISAVITLIFVTIVAFVIGVGILAFMNMRKSPGALPYNQDQEFKKIMQDEMNIATGDATPSSKKQN